MLLDSAAVRKRALRNIVLPVATRSTDGVTRVHPHQSRGYGSEGYEAGQKCMERKS